MCGIGVAMVIVGFVMSDVPGDRAGDGTGTFRAFYEALDGGDRAAALAAGREVYQRLAFEAQGEGVFSPAGLLLASCGQATNEVVQAIQGLCRSEAEGGSRARRVQYMWYGYGYVCEQTDVLAYPESAMGRFLKRYVILCLDESLATILESLPADGSLVDAQKASQTAKYLAFVPAIANVPDATDLPHLAKTVRWLIQHDCLVSAIDFCLDGVKRSKGAAAMVELALTDMPDNVEVRGQLIRVLTALRDAKHTGLASQLCLRVQEAVKDPGFSEVLVLEQAVIAGRDQTNYALAIRLCDSISGPGHTAARSVVARYLAGTFCLAKGDYREAISRMETLLGDDATPQDYHARATSLMANAWGRLGNPAKSVSVLHDYLADLPQPEPAGAAECRRALYTALLSSQRYDEAAAECRKLISLHPGHEAARSAQQVLGQLERRTPATGAATR